MFSDENKEEIISILILRFPNIDIHSITNINKIPFGSDAQIFIFDVILESSKRKFLLKLFRNRLPPERSENEYLNLCKIYHSDIKVPQPFGFLKNTCSFKRPFMIMEFTEGDLLSKSLYNNFSNKNPLLNKFVENLISIHTCYWQTIFDNLNKPDIEHDPLIIIKSIINRTKPLVRVYNILEFVPILEWLENNMLEHHSCKELVLCHGDYHPNNIIVNKKAELITLDWSNVGLSDSRIDLAFTVVVINAEIHSKVDELIISLYERLTHTTVGDLTYFKVLVHLFNFLRMYSAEKDYTITQETEETKISFLHEYRNYCLEVLRIMKENIHSSFPTIEKFLK